MKQGDTKALQLFYERNIKLFYQFGLRFIPDLEEVRDVAQEAFISMWDRVGSFKDEEHMKAFLYTAIRNRAISYLRHKEVEERTYAALAQLQDDQFFMNIALEEEVYDYLCRKIDDLPKMQRDVLRMHLSGLSNEEIARELGISIHTVNNHKQAARTKLKIYLAKFYSYLLSASVIFSFYKIEA